MTKRSVSKNTLVIMYVALAAVTLIAFEGVRHNDFVHYDDNVYVLENPHVLKGLTAEGARWALTTGHAANWHPLTWFSHMLDCEVFGLNPIGHHFVNVFLHVVNVLLLFWLLHSATAAVWPSLFVAAAFALHPTHVESVAWLAERKDALSGLFFMLTVAAYLKYAAGPGLRRYLLVIVAFGLGLMSKPMLVTMPFVLLLLDYWPLRRLRLPTASDAASPLTAAAEHLSGSPMGLRRLLVEKVPLIILAAASSVITIVAQRGGGAVVTLESLPFSSRLANAVCSCVGYLGMLFLPHDLAILYPYPAAGLPAWQVAGSAIVLVGITAGVLWLARRRPYLPVGWFLYLGMLFPVIGLVQVGTQALADRYTYLPSIGIFIMLAWGVADLIGQRRLLQVAAAAVAGAVLAALLVCTRLQIPYWKDDLALFGHALAVTQNNYVMHSNLGYALQHRGKLDEAIDQCRKSLSIKSDYSQAHGNLACALHAQGKLAEAIVSYRRALELSPNNASTHDNLGSALALQGKFNEAIEEFRQALRLAPDFVGAQDNLAKALLMTGQLAESAKYFRASLRLSPDRPMIINDLAWILATGPDSTAADHEEAVRLAEHAAELTSRRDPVILDTLGAAYASTGRFDQAIRNGESALVLASAGQAQSQDLAEGIRQRLKLYRQNKPYQEAKPAQPPMRP
jgi:protein O-mannosyl-transferase